MSIPRDMQKLVTYHRINEELGCARRIAKQIKPSIKIKITSLPLLEMNEELQLTLDSKTKKIIVQ